MYTICASACTGDGWKMWICSWPWSYFRETVLSTYLALFPLISVSFISWSYFGINDWISAESSLISCSSAGCSAPPSPSTSSKKYGKFQGTIYAICASYLCPSFCQFLIKWHSICQSGSCLARTCSLKCMSQSFDHKSNYKYGWQLVVIGVQA